MATYKSAWCLYAALSAASSEETLSFPGSNKNQDFDDFV